MWSFRENYSYSVYQGYSKVKCGEVGEIEFWVNCPHGASEADATDLLNLVTKNAHTLFNRFKLQSSTCEVLNFSTKFRSILEYPDSKFSTKFSTILEAVLSVC